MATIRLSEAVEQYLGYRRARYSASTVKADDYVLRRFLAFTGDLLVSSLTAEHVERFFSDALAEHVTRDGRTRPPVTASSHNALRKKIAAFADWLARRGRTRDDLMAHVRPLKVDRRARLQATPDLLWAMLDSAPDPRTRALLSVACNTGLRAGEIADLRVGDVDLDTLTLSVRISKSKTDDQMPITSDLEADLAIWLDEYRHWQMRDLGRVAQPTDYLFPARLGPRFVMVTNAEGVKVRESRDRGLDPLRPQRNLHEVAQQALRAVGLPTKHQGIHTIRRSVARALYDSLRAEDGHEGAIRIVMVFLHHQSQITTEQYIGVVAEKQARDVHLRGRSLLGLRPGSASVTRIR